ncbi:zinc finger, CCHC-type containing protein, partial [Tanacetum coccineum]
RVRTSLPLLVILSFYWRQLLEVWYVIGVANLRALVHTGDKTSGDARTWYMISGDAKSWITRNDDDDDDDVIDVLGLDSRIAWNDDDDDVIEVLGLDSRELPVARHSFPAARLATSEPPAARLATSEPPATRPAGLGLMFSGFCQILSLEKGSFMKMKSYLDTLECIGYAMPNKLDVSLILNSLNKDYDQFVQNYNMHNMGKTLAELHAMIKLHEKGILKKAETLTVLAIHKGKIQKDKKKLQGANNKAKGKNKLTYAPKIKITPPPKRDNPAKDCICHYCKEVGHWRRNCPSYNAELKKRKNASVGLRGSRKLKHGALSLYMGNGMRAVVESIRSFDLILPYGLIIVLDNCHFAPTVTKGVVSISRLVKNGYIHTFTNYGISVSKDNVFLFNAIPRDGIYEIDMHNLYLNVSSNYNVSNKRAKHRLDSYYLWHCHLGHINKKRMDMLQCDRLLQPTHDESHKK